MQSKRSQYLLKTSFWLRCIAVILPLLPKWDPNLQFSRQRILQNSFCQSRRQKSRNNHRVIFTTIIFSLLPPSLHDLQRKMQWCVSHSRTWKINGISNRSKSNTFLVTLTLDETQNTCKGWIVLLLHKMKYFQKFKIL